MIYLDNAATTSVEQDVIDLINVYNRDRFYNPSALYSSAVSVSQDIKKAREGISSIMGVSSDEVIFLSSGTEGDNAALLNTRKKDRSRVLISAVEHSAVYNTALELSQRGYDVQMIPVDKSGRILEEEYIKLINDNVALISIMHVCNETGAINDIVRLAEIAKNYNKSILFHSDGVQAFGKIKLNLASSKVDMYTVSGHKIGAPKGIGAMYIRKGVTLKPLLYGGGQEKNIRSSTENVAGIITLNYCASKSILIYANLYNTMRQLLQKFADFVIDNIESTVINTDFSNSSPNILSLSFKNIRGEVLMHSLEKYDIIIGIGSACTSKKGIKRIPTALNLPKCYHDGMIRISITPNTSEEEIMYTAKMLIKEHNELIKYTRG